MYGHDWFYVSTDFVNNIYLALEKLKPKREYKY